jgi:hypothetical protein
MERQIDRTCLLLPGILLLAGILPSPLVAGPPAAGERPLTQAVEQAHGELWGRFVDRHGVIRDYVGDLPTPDDCRLGRPNAIGWWSPIENGPMFTGLYLPAACERARRSGATADAELARRLAEGLVTCASVSDVPGFIARGMGSDGTCHYSLSSDDQTHPWFLGLHAYHRSGLPSADERRQIAAKVREVADALEATGWQVPCEAPFAGQFRGGFRGHLFRDAVRYLFMLRAVHEVTGDEAWLDRYERAVGERPAGSEKTRLEICAAGYPPDREAIEHIDTFQLWIYVGSQASLAGLVAMETDESRRSRFRAGLVTNAETALPAIAAHASFDNEDRKIFGNAEWRAVYGTWYPQATQEDARRLSETGDKTRQGERKYYESRFVRNPLAAAAIVALVGDGRSREAIERAIRHYDYARLNMAEFFFAERAFFALPDASVGESGPRPTVPGGPHGPGVEE